MYLAGLGRISKLANQRRLLAGLPNDADEIIYTSEHRQFREAIKKVIDRDVNPFVDQFEKEHAFPARNLFKKFAEVGVFGADKPQEYGGLGLDFSYSIAAVEELGEINCAGVPTALAVQANMATPALTVFGSDDLKRDFLAPSISGDKIACVGVSESAAGSDVASIRTWARDDGDELVINGGKMWITNGCQADWMCLLANTESDVKAGHKNKSLICLPMDSAGIYRRNIAKMGLHCSDTADISFDNVRVPKTNIIGERGKGFLYQMLQFQEERLVVAASGHVRPFSCSSALVPMERLIRATVEYTGGRQAFGRSILSNQVVQFRLAELQTEIEALRSLLYRAVHQRLQNRDVTLLASMAKLKAGRLIREVGDSCLQYWGAMGYTEEAPTSRFYRDNRVMSIGGGADEVMLQIIAKLMNMTQK